MSWHARTLASVDPAASRFLATPSASGWWRSISESSREFCAGGKWTASTWLTVGSCLAGARCFADTYPASARPRKLVLTFHQPELFSSTLSTTWPWGRTETTVAGVTTGALRRFRLGAVTEYSLMRGLRESLEQPVRRRRAHRWRSVGFSRSRERSRSRLLSSPRTRRSSRPREPTWLGRRWEK